MIVETKKGYLLINWGSKKSMQNSNLIKIPIHSLPNYQNFFQAFIILNSSQEDFFYFSPERKVENSNKLFQVSQNMIVGYPTLTSIRFETKIKGLSIGKFHSLCWDENGAAYSWGCKSLALGYESLPEENFIENPRRVHIKKRILCAFAATNYSLALTSQGKIYEWGVKKEVNEINEDPIFKPRQLQFCYFNCNRNFVCLKGKLNNYGIISSLGQLYVWGENARQLINQRIVIPSEWKGNYLYEPVLQIDFVKQKVLDFDLENNYLAIVVAQKDTEFNMKQQEEYWNLLKEKAKCQLQQFKMMRVNTQCQETQILKKKYQNSILTSQSKEMKTQRQRQNQKQQLNNISKTKNKEIISSGIRKSEKCRTFVHNFKKTGPIEKQKSDYPENPLLHKRQVSQNIRNTLNIPIDDHTYQKILRISQTSSSAINDGMKKSIFKARNSQMEEQRREKTNFTQVYTCKLNEVLSKKKNMEIFNMTENMRRIQQNTIEFRIKKRNDYQAQRKREQVEGFLKESLGKFIVNNYIVNLIIKSIDEGRSLKIENFAKSVRLQRIQRNIRRFFMKTRIQSTLKELRRTKMLTFFKLVCNFKQYVSRFRKRKYIKQRKMVVFSLVKKLVHQKIAVGVQKCQLNVRKLQKIKEWLLMVKTARKRCLKELWVDFLLSTFKYTKQKQSDSNQNIKYLDEPTFQRNYQQKIIENPHLKLCNYLQSQAIFKIRTKYFKDSTTLFLTKKKSSESDGSNILIKRKGHIKFQDNFDWKDLNKSNQGKIDFLPYSLHYNHFKRPKNLDINIPDLMKTNPTWVEIQKNILDQFINQIIKLHDSDYRQKKRKFDLELANFIKLRYQSFYEKRWKYIIQYNKVQKTVAKLKKEKELRRLLTLVGSQRMIQEDCIPEKSLILDQALKKHDAPRPPNPYINFEINEFRRIFKNYYDCINSKARAIKKNFA